MVENERKERIRRLYKIKEPINIDARILRRSDLHRYLINKYLQCAPLLHFIFVPSGFLLILLPSLNSAAARMIDSFSFTRWIYSEFSGMGPLAIGPFLVALVGLVYRMGKIDGATESFHGYPINLKNVDSVLNIRDGELFPVNAEEERVFFVDLALGVYLATFWWFMVFGLVAFIIK